ncbi:MAG: hypothetical protein ACTSQP_05660 [Promethearchaeota archaeon]
MSQADWNLLKYIRQQMGMGYTIIRIPAYMLYGTTEKGLKTAKELCKVNECELIIEV